jgi:hypothetical protein
MSAQTGLALPVLGGAKPNQFVQTSGQLLMDLQTHKISQEWILWFVKHGIMCGTAARITESSKVFTYST